MLSPPFARKESEMLPRREISIGKCYVKEKTHTIREVVDVMDRKKVLYNAYDLQTGKLLRAPLQVCLKKQMIRWADREATPEEYSNMQREEAMEIYKTGANASEPVMFTAEVIKAQSLTEARNLTPNR
jgi:hypothetical protein